MATFKVGQRVRIIGAPAINMRFLGREGVVSHIPGPAVLYWGGREIPGAWYGVEFDDETNSLRGLGWGFLREHLAPITDSKADAFLESIKKLRPYEEPKVAKTKESA